ncbi:MAG: formate--tetrahydrofolate ligase [Lancefieldella parvula]
MSEVKSDIEIAQSSEMLPIFEVAKRAGISEDLLEPYGRYKAKLDARALADKPLRGKLVLQVVITILVRLQNVWKDNVIMGSKSLLMKKHKSIAGNLS